MFITKILTAICYALLICGNVYAATITVTTNNATVSTDSFCSLTEAIQAANSNTAVRECNAGDDADSGGDIIVLASDIVIDSEFENDASHGRTGTEAIVSKITLKGNGHVVKRDSSLGCSLNAVEDAGEFRLLRIASPGHLIVENIIMKNGCADGPVNLPDSRIGGAISNFNALLEVYNSIFTDNQAYRRGAAIDSTFGGAGSLSTVVINSYFKQNHAFFGGGAVSNFTSTTAIYNSTFQQNSSDNVGGALYNIDGTAATQNSEMQIYNSTFDNNSATNYGGTLYNTNAVIPLLVNSTFANSSSGSPGKVIYNTSSASITALSTLFTNNSGGSQECYTDAGGSFTHNHGMTDNSAGGCSATQSSQINLLPLADNGCTTTLADETCAPTMALMSDSDAINPVDESVVLDQRGFNKSGTRDIGAYESLTAIEQCNQLGIIESTNGDEFTALADSAYKINQAIICGNKDGTTTDTIKLASDITLNRQVTKNSANASSGTYRIESPIIVNGQGYTLERNKDLLCEQDNTQLVTEFRIMEVSENGELQLNNIKLQNGCADAGSTQSHGGGILNNGILTINNSVIDANHANYGGGISNSWRPPHITPQLSILNSVISNNSASYDGAGLENTLATVNSIQNSVFKNNSTLDISGKGGAVYNDATSTIEDISNTGFYENNALTGGAIYNADTIGTSSGGGISNSTFANNTAMEGGAIRNQVYIYSISDSTFSGNTATNGDGGAINTSASVASIENVTFAENSASSEGGAVYSSAGVTNINHSLFNSNQGSGSDCSDSGSGQVNGNNNLSTNSGLNNFCNVTIDSGLDSSTMDRLSDNGCTIPLGDGNCVQTHALLAGSQAINSATTSGPAQTDQRNYPVLDGIRDLGAFEYLTHEQHCAQSGITLISSGFIASVSDSSELIQAIHCANFDDSTTDTINLAADISMNRSYENIDNTGLDVTSVGRTATPAISSPLNMNGMGYTLMRDNSFSCEFVVSDPDDDERFRLLRISSTGTLNLNNILLSNGCLYVDSQFHKFSGGAVYNSGQLNIRNSVLANNAAASAGSVYNFEGTMTTIENSIFTDNRANFHGGALVNESGNITSIKNSSFSRNFSFFYGGAIANRENATISEINATSFINNTSNFSGGGIYNSASINSILNSTFSTDSPNQPSDGSGIGNEKYGAEIPAINTIINSTFFSLSGYSIENSEGEITSVSNSIIGDCTEDNSVTFNGFNNYSYISNNNCPGTTYSTGLNMAQIPADNGCIESLADGSCVETHAIMAGSEAINQGDTNAINADQRGYIANGIRDIGAYEFDTQTSDLIFANSFD